MKTCDLVNLRIINKKRAIQKDYMKQMSWKLLLENFVKTKKILTPN